MANNVHDCFDTCFRWRRIDDAQLVFGPYSEGKHVRFRMHLDVETPNADHGMDIDAEGNGGVEAQRPYKLVRQAGSGSERLFDIEFREPGVQAYAFTFG